MNISIYHRQGIGELSKLHTRQLMNIRSRSFKKITCGCGPGHHCGDDVLDDYERQFNLNQDYLRDRVNDILRTREHVPNKKQAKAIRQMKAKR